VDSRRGRRLANRRSWCRRCLNWSLRTRGGLRDDWCCRNSDGDGLDHALRLCDGAQGGRRSLNLLRCGYWRIASERQERSPGPSRHANNRKNDGRGPAHNLVLSKACSEQGLCLRKARKQARSTRRRIASRPDFRICPRSSALETGLPGATRHASSGRIVPDPAVDGHSFRRSIKASGSDSVTTIPRFSVLMNPSETARSNKATSGS